jgi:hypothetical protein
MFWIWQAATPEELTAMELLPAPTQVAAEPLSRKVIEPEGKTGVNVPLSCAVKVTAVFNAEGLAGEAAGVKEMVRVAAVMVYDAAKEAAVLKSTSPE